MLTATLVTGHAMLYEFSSREHVFNWTRSEKLGLQVGILHGVCCKFHTLSAVKEQ